MRVVDEQRCTDRSQSPVGCVEKGVGGRIVLRAYPLAFQYAPQPLCDVEMRRVRGKVERRTVSSSEQFIIGLRPLPGRVSRPLTPSFLYLLNHLLTVCCSISVLSPTLAADRPSAFSSTARQRILKQCFSPWRYPPSSSCRCTSLSSNRVVDLISVQCVIHRANEIWFIIVLIGKLILNNYLLNY